MKILGKRSITILKDIPGTHLKAGDIVTDAECWLGLDCGQPCAEVHVAGQSEPIGLGRMDYTGDWRFTDDAEQAVYQKFLDAYHAYEARRNVA